MYISRGFIKSYIRGAKEVRERENGEWNGFILFKALKRYSSNFRELGSQETKAN